MGKRERYKQPSSLRLDKLPIDSPLHKRLERKRARALDMAPWDYTADLMRIIKESMRGVEPHQGTDRLS